jgi:hypothetical protein
MMGNCLYLQQLCSSNDVCRPVTILVESGKDSDSAKELDGGKTE